MPQVNISTTLKGRLDKVLPKVSSLFKNKDELVDKAVDEYLQDLKRRKIIQ